jgi:5-methylcytosine-specific restriction endonuclease McrA
MPVSAKATNDKSRGHAAFQEFLERNGAQVLLTCSPYEAARWVASGRVYVMYRNKQFEYSFSCDDARAAWTAFQSKRPWSANQAVKRISRKSVEEMLVERDGPTCWYCGTADFSANAGKPTLEHLLAVADGGSNHLSNLCLACAPCNLEAGRLPIVQKVTLRNSKRGIHA